MLLLRLLLFWLLWYFHKTLSRNLSTTFSTQNHRFITVFIHADAECLFTFSKAIECVCWSILPSIFTGQWNETPTNTVRLALICFKTLLKRINEWMSRAFFYVCVRKRARRRWSRATHWKKHTWKLNLTIEMKDMECEKRLTDKVWMERPGIYISTGAPTALICYVDF